MKLDDANPPAELLLDSLLIILLNVDKNLFVDTTIKRDTRKFNAKLASVNTSSKYKLETVSLTRVPL